MTEEQLHAIEGLPVSQAGHHVPDLIAEIRRLRSCHDGLKKKHAEVVEQWVKETNEWRQKQAELRTLLSVVCDISTAERREREEETARRRSEGAKSGWEIRRAKAAKTQRA